MGNAVSKEHAHEQAVIDSILTFDETEFPYSQCPNSPFGLNEADHNAAAADPNWVCPEDGTLLSEFILLTPPHPGYVNSQRGKRNAEINRQKNLPNHLRHPSQQDP